MESGRLVAGAGVMRQNTKARPSLLHRYLTSLCSEKRKVSSSETPTPLPNPRAPHEIDHSRWTATSHLRRCPRFAYRSVHRSLRPGHSGGRGVVPRRARSSPSAGMAGGTTSRWTPPNHRLFIARQTRVMVVDPDSGKLPGRGAGPQRRPRRGLGLRDRTWLCHVGARQHRDDVRPWDASRASADQGRGRCRRRALRSRLETGLHLQWRRRLVERARSGVRRVDRQHPARRQTRVRRHDRPRTTVREPGGQGGDRRDRSCRDEGAPALVPRSLRGAHRAWPSTASSPPVQRLPQQAHGHLQRCGRAR